MCCVSVIICRLGSLTSQLLTTSGDQARSSSRQKEATGLTHTGPATVATVIQAEAVFELDHYKEEAHIKCFIATTDDERDLLLVCCCCCCGWSWLGGCQLFLAGDHLHIMDMDPVWSWIHPHLIPDSVLESEISTHPVISSWLHTICWTLTRSIHLTQPNNLSDC